MNYSFNPKLNKSIDLPAINSWPEAPHQFDKDTVWAVKAAIAAKRPLLIRGEPGMGKSQLARAVATYLKLPFLSYVVNERSEATDLLYDSDTVSRLAQAQLAATAQTKEDREEAMARVAEERFLRPGPLWWAFDWHSAEAQRKRYYRESPAPEHPSAWKAGNGSVLLIDEMDKADTSVPNALLESLGNTGFQLPFGGQSVSLPKSSRPPLVFITTNEERELPAAFLRRCLVLQLNFPDKQEDALAFLLERGRVHSRESGIGPAVAKSAAELLIKDREFAIDQGGVRPGAAEYLDLLRAMGEIAPNDENGQSEALAEIAKFALRKNPPENLF